MTDGTNGTAARGPVSREEAIALVSSREGWRRPDGSAGTWTAQEFDQGYVVYPEMPPFDPAAPSAMGYGYGAGCVLVDKADGAFTHLPFHGVEGSIEMYRRMHGR